jgi:hypothetical protein
LTTLWKQSTLTVPHSGLTFAAQQTILAIEEDATTHSVEFKDVQNLLAKTNAYTAGVCKGYQLVKPPKIRISKLHRQVGAVSDSESVFTT